MLTFRDAVHDLSGGEIRVKVYHSAQLADQKTGILSVKNGSLEMCADASPSWFVDLANFPEIGVLEAPYVFRDIDHMYRVLTGPIGQRFWNELADKSGIRVVDVWYLGTRELNLTKEAGPVYRPEDLQGIKLRMPNTEAWLDVGRSLGAKPTPLGFEEVYLALKTGTIDGQDNPLPTDYASKFHEVTHYIVLTDHMIGYVTPIINEDLWQSLTKKQRFAISRAAQIARFYNNSATLAYESKLVGEFETRFGMEIIVPDKQAFMNHAREYYSQKRFQKAWGPGAYEEIQSYQ